MKYMQLQQESPIIDRSAITINPDGTVNHRVEQYQDVAPIIADNEFMKLHDAANGFSEKRLFRKIASIPLLAYQKALQEGYNMGDMKDVRKFLSLHPEYLAVQAIDTGRDGKIIIK